MSKKIPILANQYKHVAVGVYDKYFLISVSFVVYLSRLSHLFASYMQRVPAYLCEHFFLPLHHSGK